jgi:hypothetical protein
MARLEMALAAYGFTGDNAIGEHISLLPLALLLRTAKLPGSGLLVACMLSQASCWSYGNC